MPKYIGLYIQNLRVGAGGGHIMSKSFVRTCVGANEALFRFISQII